MLHVVKIFIVLIVVSKVFADYWTNRDAFIKLEKSQMLGASIVLTEKEKKVNDILMKHKFKEFDKGMAKPKTFAPSQHFFQARPLIEKSEVFKLIKKMPKGGALHGHDIALVSSEYLYKQTLRNNLYACIVNDRLLLKFLTQPSQDNTCRWILLKTLRDVDKFYDTWVRSQITLYTEHPLDEYPSINEVWDYFQNIFGSIFYLLTYRPVFEDYLYNSLKDLYDDNVMYLELRGTLPPLYELNGTVLDPIDTVDIYKNAINKFKKDYPKFVGARFIYAPMKEDNNTIHKTVDTVKALKEKHPEFMAGYDLVGQEDTRHPIHHYLQDLKSISALGVDFFFHAGETNWYETDSDFNLVDAILLGTKRIGHAYAVTKHPLVMKYIKERNIAIEVCPISNQVLMLVSDLRNHPAATLIANGYPVVISYDDPTLWNVKGLSYDFYVTFMGIAGKDADMKLLKQLALNSFLYSTLPEKEKQAAISAWEKDWNNFVDNVLTTYSND